MRIMAQCAFAAIVLFLAFTWKYALLLPLLWPFFVLAAAPIAWYVVFDRHRESANDEILIRLDAIANAIRDAQSRASSESPFRQSARI